MNKQLKPETAPDSAFDKARAAWFEAYGSSIVEKSRWFTIAVAEMVCIVALVIAIATMMPLKTVVPYVIKVSSEGNVTATAAGVQAYKPEEREIRYFLSQWVTKLYTLDHSLTEQHYLPEAYALTRDKAIDEFTSWIDQNKPLVVLQSNPTLTQSVIVKSISFVQEGVALVRFRFESRTTEKVIITDRLLTIHYAVIPPKTEKEIYENPIGLFITHFAVSEDIQ